MWIASIKEASQKVWSLAKKYWQVIVGFLAAIILFKAFRRPADPTEILKVSNDTHDKVVDALNTAREEEQKAVDAALKNHDATIEKIEKKYLEEKKELTDQKREEIKKVIEDSRENPEDVTKKLAELTGFTLTDS